MPNKYVIQRLTGIQTQLNGVHQANSGMSTATTGQERAAVIDDFLSRVLPPVYRFGTGDATDITGNRSGQLDVVIEYPFAPSLPIVGGGQTRLYLAESVAAVVEVKSNISSQWSQARNTAAALAPLKKSIHSSFTMGMAPIEFIPLFVVAYTGWKTQETIKENLAAAHDIHGVLVIDAGLYVSKFGTSGSGAGAFWGLICDLHAITTSLQSAGISPIEYMQ